MMNSVNVDMFLGDDAEILLSEEPATVTIYVRGQCNVSVFTDRDNAIVLAEALRRCITSRKSSAYTILHVEEPLEAQRAELGGFANHSPDRKLTVFTDHELSLT